MHIQVSLSLHFYLLSRYSVSDLIRWPVHLFVCLSVCPSVCVSIAKTRFSQILSNL